MRRRGAGPKLDSSSRHLGALYAGRATSQRNAACATAAEGRQRGPTSHPPSRATGATSHPPSRATNARRQ